MRWLKDKRAVSPVVGVILMVAITIVLAATIYIWISSMSSPAATAPSINLRGTWEKDESGTGKVLVLTVVSVQGDARWEDLQISAGSYKVSNDNSGMVQAGQQIIIYKDNSGDAVDFGSGEEITVQITHVPSNSVIYENTFLVPQTSGQQGSGT